MRSVTSTAILLVYLSPWGDNNPVTLPNVRKRDFTYAALGDLALEDIFESSLEAMDPVVNFLAGETIEKVEEETVDGLKPTKALKIIRTA